MRKLSWLGYRLCLWKTVGLVGEKLLLRFGGIGTVVGGEEAKIGESETGKVGDEVELEEGTSLLDRVELDLDEMDIVVRVEGRKNEVEGEWTGKEGETGVDSGMRADHWILYLEKDAGCTQGMKTDLDWAEEGKMEEEMEETLEEGNIGQTVSCSDQIRGHEFYQLGLCSICWKILTHFQEQLFWLWIGYAHV